MNFLGTSVERKIVRGSAELAKEDFSTAQIISGIWLKRTFIQGERGLWHLRVAEGDHLSERSEGGKLPQHKTRALATLRKLKTFLRGCSGGSAGGSRRGAAPNKPPLPRAAQASQTPVWRKTLRPKGKKQRIAAHRAGVPTSPEGEKYSVQFFIVLTV